MRLADLVLFNTAYLYAERPGVAREYTEVFVWHCEADEQAQPASLFTIARAFRYYHRAAEFGHAEATRILSKIGQ